MIKDETKQKIDLMSIEELKSQIDLGNRSPYNQEKRDYMKIVLNKKLKQESNTQRVEDISYKEKELDLTEEANRLSRKSNEISRKSNNLSKIAITVSIVAILIVLTRLIVQFMNKN